MNQTRFRGAHVHSHQYEMQKKIGPDIWLVGSGEFKNPGSAYPLGVPSDQRTSMTGGGTTPHPPPSLFPQVSRGVPRYNSAYVHVLPKQCWTQHIPSMGSAAHQWIKAPDAANTAPKREEYPRSFTFHRPNMWDRRADSATLAYLFWLVGRV